jgi:3-isopropylmalate dehydrogenase
MLLDSLGETQASSGVLSAIECNLRAHKVRTFDLGGRATTSEVGSDITKHLQESVG